MRETIFEDSRCDSGELEDGTKQAAGEEPAAGLDSPNEKIS